MRRLLATLLTAATLVTLAGCSRHYENRVNVTLERMRYLQRLDQFLQPPAADQLQPMGIYLRPPKPLTRAAAPLLTPADPGQFDLLATFLDVSGASAEDGAAPPPALRLHVLARSKQAQAEAAKKSEEEGIPPTERADFLIAVLEVLASNLGGVDPYEAPRQPETKRANTFDRVAFNAANGDLVRAYFFRQEDYDVALVWVIPPGLEQTPAATTAADLTLETLSVGPRAVAAFQGIDPEEGVIQGGTADTTPETGVAF